MTIREPVVMMIVGAIVIGAARGHAQGDIGFFLESAQAACSSDAFSE
jgi:hypothetical protein